MCFYLVSLPPRDDHPPQQMWRWSRNVWRCKCCRHSCCCCSKNYGLFIDSHWISRPPARGQYINIQYCIQYQYPIFSLKTKSIFMHIFYEMRWDEYLSKLTTNTETAMLPRCPWSPSCICWHNNVQNFVWYTLAKITLASTFTITILEQVSCLGAGRDRGSAIFLFSYFSKTNILNKLPVWASYAILLFLYFQKINF